MKKKSPLLLLGILAVFTLAQTANMINPAMNSLIEYYGQVPRSTVLMLSTATSLAVIPCSLIAGALAGRKIGYKTLSILATILILAGGLLPCIAMPSFAIVMFTRLLVGAGVGISSPIANALVMRLVPKEKQALWQGVGTAVMNVAGMLYTNLVGVLCVTDVKLIWLVHGLLVLPLVLMIFFLKEPERTSEPVHKTEETGAKSPLPFSAILTCVGFGLLFLMMYPFLLNISSVIVEEGLGTSAQAGVVLSAYSIGGMAAGFVFGGADRLLGKFLMPVSLLMQALGMALCSFGGQLWVLFLGAVLIGVAIHWVWPACVMTFSALQGKQGTLASGLFISCLHLGTFLSAPFIGLVEGVSGSADPRVPLAVGTAGTVVIAMAWALTWYKQALRSKA